MRLFFACLIACALGAAADEPGLAQGKVRVLVWNIHGGVGADGKLDLGRIAAGIKSVKADVVALQEVDRKTKRSGGADQIAELARLTGLRSTFAVQRRVDGGEEALMLLSPHTLIGPSRHELPEGSAPAVALAASLAVGQRRLQIVTVDLDGRVAERVVQAAKLNGLFGKKPGNFLLVGSFDSEPGTDLTRLLGTKWRRIGKTGPKLPTFPAPKPTLEIDLAWIRPASAFHKVSRVTLDLPGSDHKALLVTVELRTP